MHLEAINQCWLIFYHAINASNKNRSWLSRISAVILLVTSRSQSCGGLDWRYIDIPSRELTYPTLGKGKSSSKCHFFGDMLVPWRVYLFHQNFPVFSSLSPSFPHFFSFWHLEKPPGWIAMLPWCHPSTHQNWRHRMGRWHRLVGVVPNHAKLIIGMITIELHFNDISKVTCQILSFLEEIGFFSTKSWSDSEKFDGFQWRIVGG